MSLTLNVRHHDDGLLGSSSSKLLPPLLPRSRGALPLPSQTGAARLGTSACVVAMVSQLLSFSRTCLGCAAREQGKSSFSLTDVALVAHHPHHPEHGGHDEHAEPQETKENDGRAVLGGVCVGIASLEGRHLDFLTATETSEVVVMVSVSINLGLARNGYQNDLGSEVGAKAGGM